ncbi:putative proteasome-type protease [Stella humosa]|uniref:Putative proteasome-type protease n=1 Tax=Stella humosa TaxID=94 RepID=A0A3N1KUF8_9PROT|nr:peptidase [Stella humosa]ROP84211.1 putative proteasome-type protease [Stella humosa]BBK33723.1 peptidase [Stella humosa]
MTYCVGLLLSEGLVMLADTRTNAGVDNISTFRKLHFFEVPGERTICIASAGNLGVTQAVMNLLTEGFESEATGTIESLYTVPSMFRAAQLTGEAVRKVWHLDGEAMRQQSIGFEVTLLLGGQIAGRQLRLFLCYSAGNFIEATEDTPFLQIGEHKYGKPILDRAVQFGTAMADGVKLALISMDSTLRSNLTVGLPIDLMVFRRNAERAEINRRIGEDDPYFRMIRERWSAALRDAHRAIPRPDWMPESTS